MRYKILVFLGTTALIVAVSSLFIPNKTITIDEAPATVLPSTNIITSTSTGSVKENSTPTESTPVFKEKKPEDKNLVKTKFNIYIDTKVLEYYVSVKPGSNIHDAMQKLASTHDFEFSGKNFSGMGFFVESINGMKNSMSMNWVYYINGSYATVGISGYTLKEGDTIEWKYEKLK